MRPLARGIAAARANLIPGIILNIFAAAVVGSYFLLPAVAEWFNHLAAFKERIGYLFAVCSTAIFGGLLPIMLQRLGAARRDPIAWLPWLLPFWAFKGAEVNALYDFQAWLFGSEPSFTVVALKVFIDQGIYVVFWSTITQLIYYQWLANGRRLRPVLRRIDRRWISMYVIPMIITNWCLWTPAICFIYCLPVALQLPMQNLVLCLWVLLLSFLVSSDDEQGPGDAGLTPASTSPSAAPV